MITEIKRLETLGHGKTSFGFVSLSKLVDTKTVKITHLGKRIIPYSFNIYGEPVFTNQQMMIFTYKNGGIKQNDIEDIELQVSYEERHFDVPEHTFNTLEGIFQSISSLTKLNEMLKNRMIYRRANPEKSLNEFILFGYLVLDSLGQIWSIEKSHLENLSVVQDVEAYESFCERNRNWVYVLNPNSELDIPKTGDRCPCCGKRLKILDIKNNSFMRKGKFIYHSICLHTYERFTEINKFTKLMNTVYGENYTFSLLHNGYYNKSCHSHIPWFLFCTKDGDIKIGNMGDVIFIEWQENYKPFDIFSILTNEKPPIWGGLISSRVRRGLYAHSYEKVLQYLLQVKNVVNL